MLGCLRPFLIQPAFRQAFNSDPVHPLRRAFEANKLDGFKPLAPLMMCHGSNDPLVTVANTDTVARAFQVALEAIPAGPPRAVAYHFVGMPFCNTQARAFFELHMSR